MNDHSSQINIDPEARQRGHEVIETDVQSLIRYGIVVAVVTIIALILMWVMFKTLKGQESGRNSQDSALVEERSLPPLPRLQVTPEADLAVLRAREDSVLTTYKWVVRDAKIVRLPIDRAIELTAERGLPVRITHTDSLTTNGR